MIILIGAEFPIREVVLADEILSNAFEISLVGEEVSKINDNNSDFCILGIIGFD